MSVSKDVSSLKFLLDLPSVCFLGKQRTPLLLDNLGSFKRVKISGLSITSKLEYCVQVENITMVIQEQ